jgi:hypothetical protein
MSSKFKVFMEGKIVILVHVVTNISKAPTASPFWSSTLGFEAVDHSETSVTTYSITYMLHSPDLNRSERRKTETTKMRF